MSLKAKYANTKKKKKAHSYLADKGLYWDMRDKRILRPILKKEK